MRSAFRRWATPAFVLACCALQGQTVPISPPSLSGVSGGGSVELGQQVVLQPIVFGSSTGLAYQWRKAGNDIAGATNSLYTIAAATANDAGVYAVNVSNAAGSSVATTEITVKAPAAPVITVAPRATVAQVGQTVTFSFSATGSFPRTYQWRKDGADIPGATAATLALTNVTTAAAGVYAVQVTNSLGSVTSASASLTVNAATTVVIASNSPNDATFIQGQQASLFVSLSAGSSPFTYQWTKNGVAIPTGTGGQLTFNPIDIADAGRYSVTVTNPAGSATSREATITVTPATPVTFTSQPRSLTVFEGERADFSVNYNSNVAATVQWLKNDAPIPGATSTYYSIEKTSRADAGSYSVAVKNIVGSVTSASATLVVNPAVVPAITTEPRDVTVSEGESIDFNAAASGSPPLTYQWYRNGVPIAGATYARYSVYSVTLADAGPYALMVKNAAGAVTTRAATLTVTPRPPPPVMNLSNVVATLGERTQIYSYPTSSGNFGNLTYQWYRDGQPIAGATNGAYELASPAASDVGTYFVVLTNSSGSTTSLAARLELLQSSTPPAGAWVAAERSGDIVYFVFTNPARIERFNLVTENWLPSIPLARTAASFAVSSTAFYLSSGSLIYRYNLDGTGETIFSSAFDSAIGGLTLVGNFLLAQTSGYSSSTLTALRVSDGARASTANYSYYWGPKTAAAPGMGKLFSRTTGISPSDIVSTTFSAAGVLGTSATDSPYHGDFPDARRVFVSPNEAYVADDSGTVYTTFDLRFAGGLGGRVDDLAYTATSQPVVLRGGSVILYDNRFIETGRAATGISAARLFVQGNTAFVFGYPPTGGTIRQAKISLSQVNRGTVAAPVDANTIAFTPDATFVDRDGIVCLYSRLYRQIFRWSSSQKKFLAPIPLLGWPNFVTYSATTHRIYLGYPDARILQVRLDAGSVLEEPFVTAPQQVLGLTTAGEYVFLVDPTGAWVSYYVYAPDGSLRAQREWSYLSAEYAWNPVLRRMYQFRDDTSPNDLLYTEISTSGAIGTQKDSPYHGEIITRYPIRISPDGGSVLLGTGKFYDATAMTPNNSLANSIDDATWSGGKLFTGHAATGGAELQRWGGNNYGLDRTRVLGGRLVRMFTLSGGRILAVTVRENITFLTMLDEELNELSSSSGLPPTRLANLATRAMAGRDAQMLIPGFVIAGTQSKRVLIRAAGPALAGFGVSGTLVDPRIAIYNQAGAVIGTNDDWSSATNASDIAAVGTQVGAFAFTPGSRDAAALITLDPGAYTVQTRGANDATGVALVEIYDTPDGSSSRIVNIAARAQVGTGADMLIPGIVVQGSTPKTLLIRAIGPGLATFGVPGTLNDPLLRLYQGDQVRYQNDNWSQSPGTTAADIASAAVKSGAFALTVGSRDAALLVTLQPGSYTAQVSGADGGTGVALVEVYEVQP